MAQRMVDDGIKVIVPLWRGDIYGNELYNSTKTNFEKLGGIVEEGVNYHPYTGEICHQFTSHKFHYVESGFRKIKCNCI